MVPFFLVNWIMGLARYPLKDFYWVTQLGMLPVTIIYVNLGTELAKIDTLDNILSPSVWVSIAILAFLPLIGKRLTHYFVPVEKSAHRPDRQSR